MIGATMAEINSASAMTSEKTFEALSAARAEAALSLAVLPASRKTGAAMAIK